MLFVFSCHHSVDEAKEETAASKMSPPVQSFEYTEETEIIWENIDSKEIQPPQSYPLDLDEIPWRPLQKSQFESLQEPFQAKPLAWQGTPQIPILPDSVVVSDFELRSAPIPKPEIREIDLPGIQEDLKHGFTNLSQSEGLPDDIILDIISDGYGGLWIATSTSLCYFEGKRLRIYPYTEVEALLIDDESRLWTVSDQEGIHILDFVNNVDFHYASDENFIEIIRDKQGAIWAISNSPSGIFQIDMKTLTIKRFRLPAGSGVCVEEDQAGNIWIGSQNLLVALNADRTTYKSLDIEGFNINFITDIYEDDYGNIWAGNYFGQDILKISLQKDSVYLFKEYSGSGNNIGQFLEDQQGRILIATNRELSMLNTAQNKIKRIPIHADILRYWQNSHMLIDDHGVLWIGTIGRGIILKDLHGIDVEYLDKSNGITDGEIWEVTESSFGQIWIGSQSGIDIISKDLKKVKHLNHGILRTGRPNLQVAVIEELENGNFLFRSNRGFNVLDLSRKRLTLFSRDQQLDVFVYDIDMDADENLWLSTAEGIVVFNDRNKTIQRIYDNSDQIAGDLVWQLIEDEFSNYWLATDQGLVIINPKKNTLKHLTKEQGLIDNDIRAIEVDDQGKLWVATLKGLSIIDIQAQTITNLGKYYLYSDVLYDLVEGKQHMYIGSVNGLIVINKTPESNGQYLITHLGASQGFLRNDYHQNTGMFSSRGQLWMAASFDAKLAMMELSKPFNFQGLQVRITGLNILDESFSLSASTSQVDTIGQNSDQWVSRLDYDDKIKWKALKRPHNIPEGLLLSHDYNSLSFNFACNDIYFQDKIEYRYILEGRDTEWSPATQEAKTPNYYNLSPGDYTFKVSSRIFREPWSSSDELQFTILPPWWQTWWAYMLYGLSLAGIIAIFVHFRSKRLKQKNRDLEKTIADRTQQLRDTIEDLKATQDQLIHSEKMASLGELTAGIAHEIQNPLNFVNNFSEVSSELVEDAQDELKKGDLKEAQNLLDDLHQNLNKIHHHGDRASSIVKGMLAHSRSGSDERVLTNINALCDEYLRLAYHGMRAKDKSFNVSFEADLDPNLPLVSVAPQDIGRVLLNLINNAFAAVRTNPAERKPLVKVSTKKLTDQIEIKISDNGTGIPDKIKEKIFQPFFTTKPTGEGTGLGLSLSYDIVKAHGGKIEVDSTINEGTDFIIKLPMTN